MHDTLSQKSKILNIHIAILVAFLLTGCNRIENNPVVFREDVENALVDTMNVRDENLEMVNQFSMNDILFNEGIKINLDFELLKNMFPSIYTIKKPEIFDMMNCDSIAYVNSSSFEKCGPNTCRLLSIQFDENIKHISIGQKKISRNTTLTELAKMFKECKTMEQLKVHGDTTLYNACLVMSGYQDFGLHIFSSKGIISRIDIWEPS